jgi:SPP1 gp7 family putative phage head morphogenesis protein
MDKRAQALAELRARRRIMQVAGLKPRTRRMPRVQMPSGVQLAYFAELRAMVRRMGQLTREFLFPEFPSILREARSERRQDIRTDAAGRRAQLVIERVQELFGREYPQARIERLAEQIGERTSDFQREQLFRQIKAALGVDLNQIREPGLRARIQQFTEGNVSLITSIPTRFFDDVEARVTQAVRAGSRAEVLAEDLEGLVNLPQEHAENRAKLIARDQTLSFYAELNQSRQESLGVERYSWRSSGDNRVRDAHAEFAARSAEGETFAWDDGPGDGSPEEGVNPGDAINCRCYADPDLTGILAEIG